MLYRETPPRAELRADVECFWTLQSPADPHRRISEQRVLPDGCIDIIFDFSRLQTPCAYVVGTMSRPLWVALDDTADLLGIRFHPGASRHFLDIFAADCTDDSAGLECFWGKKSFELWERLAQIDEPQSRIHFLETHALSAFGCDRKHDPYVQYAVKAIQKSRGNLCIKGLERGTGLSSRQLERKFARDIGLSPKSFARIMRFQNVARLAKQAPRPDWAAIALNCGYADQPHLIREFKEFSDVSPVDFFRSR